MWTRALTPKSCRYYAISKYASPEKTWTGYFKAMKSLETLVDAVSKDRLKRLDKRKLLACGNDAALAFSKEAATRICFALTDEESHPEIKTLLEWLGLYWKHEIPEAKLNDVPWAIELADKLQEFNCRKKG